MTSFPASLSRVALFAAAAAVLIAPAFGQQDKKAAARAKWSALATSDAPGKGDTAAQYLARAGDLKNFAESNPDADQLPEAQRLEALNLLSAAELGDKAADARRDSVVATVRADTRLPASERLEVAARADNLKHGGSAATADDMEVVARGLAREFPEVPLVFESLLHLAEATTDAKGLTIAQDLLAMPASDQVKAAARRLIERFNLIGHHLPSLVWPGGPPKDAPKFNSGHIVILYSWKMDGEGSILGQSLAEYAPKGAIVIGVNGDPDSVAASSYAASHHLAGYQLYGTTGTAPLLAQQFPPVNNDFVIVTDRAGSVVTVSARVGLLQAIASANR